MIRCDWTECGKVGFWDGVTADLINSEGQKNIKLGQILFRFIFLCPKHFALAVTRLLPKKNLSPSAP
jgi:hypothetical protein